MGTSWYLEQDSRKGREVNTVSHEQALFSPRGQDHPLLTRIPERAESERPPKEPCGAGSSGVGVISLEVTR